MATQRGNRSPFFPSLSFLSLLLLIARDLIDHFISWPSNYIVSKKLPYGVCRAGNHEGHGVRFLSVCSCNESRTIDGDGLTAR